MTGASDDAERARGDDARAERVRSEAGAEVPGRSGAMLTEPDQVYLRLAVELSRGYDSDHRRGPFGAVLVADGEIIGQGFNQVAELCDPTAHAEVMALRAAGRALGRPGFENSVLYSSAEPCPMCLAACYWASVSRVVFAATSRDLAECAFRDLAIYTELRRPVEHRSMREDASQDDLRREAVLAVRDWTRRR